MNNDGEEQEHPHGVARRVVLLTRVSEEEEALIRAAVQTSPDDLTEWIKHTLLAAAKRELKRSYFNGERLEVPTFHPP